MRKRISNKLQLPRPIYEAIINSGYDPGESDITATGLIEPVRIGALKRLHGDAVQEDASDLIYSLQGQSVHTILERVGPLAKLWRLLTSLVQELGSRNDPYEQPESLFSVFKEHAAEFFTVLRDAVLWWRNGRFVTERRFYIKVDGWKVGAQIDVFDREQALIQDYKLTSVYSVKDGIKEEYAQQMNIQAEVLRQNGYEVKALQIVAILRDWTKGDRDRDATEARARGVESTYPQHQIKILDVPLIPSEEVLGYIAERVHAHRAAREGKEADLPVCSADERWARPDTYAVLKKGQKKAVKLFASEDAAKLFIEAQEIAEARIDHRPGVSIRCQQYCPVKEFCSVAKKKGWTQ